jgi:hypothetical protein
MVPPSGLLFAVGRVGGMLMAVALLTRHSSPCPPGPRRALAVSRDDDRC